MNTYMNKHTAGLLVTEEDGIEKSAMYLPEDTSKGALVVWSSDRVSLTHTMKLASELFDGGRVVCDENTRFLGDSSKDWALCEFTKEANGKCIIEDSIYPSLIKTAASMSKDEEMELWKSYNKTGDKRALRKLMHSFTPLVRSRVRPWVKNSPLPKSAVEAEGMRLLRHGINTYNPNKGAALNTHVWHQLSKIHRYGYKYQNVGSIPEPRAAKVGVYQNAYELLKDKKNRDPTIQELRQELGWKISDLKAIDQELRQDLVLDDNLGPIGASNTDPAVEALFTTYHSATPKQQLVMEHTFDDFEGKETLDGVKEISNRLGISEAEVRKEHRFIASEIKDILDAGKVMY